MVKTYLEGTTIPVLQSQLLSQEAEIIHFSTLRDDHSTPYSGINLCNYTGDSILHVVESRKSVADALHISADRIAMPRQVHGTDIWVVKETCFLEVPEADAVITNVPNMLIGVSTADCVPVLLYDKEAHVASVVHAGWRGTIARIVQKTIFKMQEEFGTHPSDIIAAIGPSISPEAFEVGEEVASVFAESGFSDCIVVGFAKPHVDLWKTNVLQMLKVGVKEENIDCTPLCTFNNDHILFSARKSGIKSGRIATMIMLKNN